MAESNLELLTPEGLWYRKEQLKALYDAYGKASHFQAMESADNLLKLIQGGINREVFKRDILANTPTTINSLADIIIADVPYGNLVSWSEDEPFAINRMLGNLLNNLNENAIVAVISDKSQRIDNPQFRRIERFQIGKRKIEILKKRACFI